MKNKISIFSVLLVVTILSQEGKAQDDPLRDYEAGLEFRGSFGFRQGPQYFKNGFFETPSGDFQYEYPAFAPDFGLDVLMSKILKNKETGEPWGLVKSGVSMGFPTYRLRDEQNNKMQHTRFDIRIPVMFHLREPMEHRTVKGDFFRAFDWGFGVYAGTSFLETLSPRGEMITEDDYRSSISFGKVINFGFMAELGFNSLNKKGKGHHYGLRFSADLLRNIVISDTDFELYPASYSISFFYNLRNGYFKDEE